MVQTKIPYLRRPLKLIVNPLSTIHFILHTMTHISTQARKYSKYFNKIMFKYQKIFLVSSSSREATTYIMSKNTINFLQNSSPIHAHVMVNSLFEDNKLIVLVSPSVATLFLRWIFL